MCTNLPIKEIITHSHTTKIAKYLGFEEEFCSYKPQMNSGSRFTVLYNLLIQKGYLFSIVYKKIELIIYDKEKIKNELL